MLDGLSHDLLDLGVRNGRLVGETIVGSSVLPIRSGPLKTCFRIVSWLTSTASKKAAELEVDMLVIER